tara:strand:+ start:144 stop:323 length:180 start_codon:yes stop_codon:yes gene_type:complete
LKLVTRIIKAQNVKLLENIAEYIGVDKDELLEKYLKPNYYTPRVINSKVAEERQKYMIR